MEDIRLKRPNPIFYRRTTEMINDGCEFSFDDVIYQHIDVPLLQIDQNVILDNSRLLLEKAEEEVK